MDAREAARSGPDAAPRREAGHFSLLQAFPVVLYTLDAWEVFDPASALWSIVEALAGRPLHLLVGATWTLEQPNNRDHHVSGIRKVTESMDGVTITTCCTKAEMAALQAEGLTPLHCSNNALVREDLFVPLTGRDPTFDAIYDAKWADYKRHHLAGGIRSLALLAGPSGNPLQDATVAHGLHALAAVRHATWIRRPWTDKSEWLSLEEVNAAYNRARVGLCLSSVEGPMYASIQYLLAGLPVVTTRNLGGRDEFLDPAYTRWVDDGPDAVADAVAELIELDLDPWMIREATLSKVAAHRSRMQEWMCDLIESEGGDLGRWGGEWPKGLRNKLIEPVSSAADVIAEINAASAFGH